MNESIGERETQGLGDSRKPVVSIGEVSSRRAEEQRQRFRVGDVVLGRYRIVGELGQGGMGVVFRCFDQVGGVDVALKALPPELSHNSVEMEEVRDNFRLVQGLHHPNIAAVKTLEVDSDSGDFYLVMECVPGGNLRRWRKEGPGGRRTLEETLPVLRQIAAALDFAHSRKIMHRDIKPSNAMLAADGTVKVLDFGLAAQIHTSLGRVSMVKYGTSGTGPYMAPEQWRGQRQGAATDQYGLAVLVYEVLAGELPFENADPSVLRQAVLNEPPPAIPGLPPKAWKALQRGLAKDAAQRFPNCAAFVDALAGLKGAGKRKTEDGRTREEGTRSRLGAWAAVAAVLLTAAGGVWWFSQSDPSDRPATRAAVSVQGRPSAAREQDAGMGRATSPREPSSTEGVTPPVASTPRDEPIASSQAQASLRLKLQPAGAALAIVRDGRLIHEVAALPAAGATLDLTPGRYTFTASKAGYRVLNEVVDVATNSLPWERALAELTGQFTLQSTPGAEVVALNEAGETRTVGRVNDAGELRADFLLEGRYRFRVTHKDYEPADVADVEIVDGKPAAVKRLLVGLPGRLRMASSKPAEIWEGGKALGKTDETISGLSAGAHALEVRRKGFRTERLRVDVPANGFVNLTAPAFVAEAGGVRVSATVPAHAQAHFAQTAKRLKLGTNPWKPLSALPHVEEGLACETVDVWMEAEGYQPDAPSRRVTVEDGKVAAAAFSLEPLPAKLVVDCAAPGAEVLDAGGQRLGAAGAVLAVPALATASFVVRADGHEDATLPLAALQPGRVHRQSVALMARKGPKLREAMTLDLGGGVGMEMVWIPAGEFDMGSNDFESEKKPVHRVRIGKGFWMGKYEVTNGQYRRFLADSGYDGRGEADGDYQKHFRGNSDQPTGADYPMIWVSWNNAQAFCRWLSQKVNGTVRLPTEAEWEYACRAGTTSRFYSGNTDSDLDGIAWHGGNSGGKTHPVGQKQANAWGLHDMSGNVWEWCQDWYGTYPSGEMTDPTGASSGSRRVLRGGSWLSNPVYCRSAYRYDSDPSYTGDNDGFRVVGVR